ncbi:MAG TPA: hypothetical protein VMP08_11545, partial [Anaerolineae bacterium]|nr:hypothetical protein [Anaerolineae bacterium]
MRVTEKDDRLILHTSWSGLLSPIFFGLFAMLIAGGMFWSAGREATLTCRRIEVNQIQCQLQQTFLGRVVQQQTIDNPQQAIVQTSHSSKGGTTYRMALVTAKGTIPLTDFYSSDVDADGLAAQFNQFQRSLAAKTVTLDQPASGFIFILLAMFIGFGLVMILTTHYDTFVFDRYRDAVTFTRLGFTGVHTREESINGLTTEVRQFRGSKGRRYYCVFLRLTGGAADIKLDWNASNESKAQDLADRIQEFVKPGVHIKYAN